MSAYDSKRHLARHSDSVAFGEEADVKAPEITVRRDYFAQS
jgi:hypothetical protein